MQSARGRPNLPAISVSGRVTAARGFATPESGSTLTVSRTDDDTDIRSVDLDGAVHILCNDWSIVTYTVRILCNDWSIVTHTVRILCNDWSIVMLEIKFAPFSMSHGVHMSKECKL